MQIDVPTRAPPMASTSFVSPLDPKEWPGASWGTPCRPAPGSPSLVISRDAASLYHRTVEAARRLYETTAVVSVSTPLKENVFTLLDIDWFATSVPSSTIARLERGRLEALLRSAFETDALENGVDHPAESVLTDALSTPTAGVLDSIRQYTLDATDPAFAASTLRCLGRLTSPGTHTWRTRLIQDALRLDVVEIRDAAAQAVDSWADRSLAPMLAAHREPTQWLRNYIQDVIDDLRTSSGVSGS